MNLVKNKELNRHEIRIKALQSLFPLDFNVDLTKDAAIQNALSMDDFDVLDDDDEKFTPPYLDTLVTGVIEQKSSIDEIITKHLTKNWSLKRISKMDLIILRLAIFEMMYQKEEVDAKIAVNEALELAKAFSDENSTRFINGVLDNVLRNI
ncbi:transcription antitermination factor NusB [Pilibacter termitis]|uniref:transcription antitermination factor NusB n=1 Tax=Pilibacter termitis TaxID=263852 RepID=UPI001F0107CA|nr:transcription antitermination factor NusB [Pilibacter termitis]